MMWIICGLPAAQRLPVIARQPFHGGSGVYGRGSRLQIAESAPVLRVAQHPQRQLNSRAFFQDKTKIKSRQQNSPPRVRSWPLQSVIGVIERRRRPAGLSNVLLSAPGNNRLSLAGSDLEVELVATRELRNIPTREMRFPGGSSSTSSRRAGRGWKLRSDRGRSAVIKAGPRSRFTLATLPAAVLVDEINAAEPEAVAREFRRLIDQTHFRWPSRTCATTSATCCSEAEGKQLRAVTTDAISSRCRNFAGKSH